MIDNVRLDKLTPAHVQRLVAETRNTTGLRRGELLALWWDDIDLGSRQLHVLRALQRVGGKLKMGQAQDWQLRADGRAA